MGFKQFQNRDPGARKPKRFDKARAETSARSEPERPWRYYSLMLPRGFRGIRS